jgi:glycerophosphoryl diester phosphodiesterase
MIHHKANLDDAPFPPNSLEAIRACLDFGAAWIEIDVMPLADGDYLVIHDARLDHETSGVGLVGEMSAAAARSLLIRDSDCRVPLLSEVVALMLDHAGSARLQIDYKNLDAYPDDEPLSRFVNLIEPIGERLQVSSLADWHLRRLKMLAPWLDTGFDPMLYFAALRPEADKHADRQHVQTSAHRYRDDSPAAPGDQRITDYLADRCAALIERVPEASTFYVDYFTLAASLGDGFNWAEALHARNIQLAAWTIDVGNPDAVEKAKRLHAAGVDRFTSNTPVVLAASLRDPSG